MKTQNETTGIETIDIKRIVAGVMTDLRDQVTIEEPLEIQVAYSTPSGYMQKSIAVTMRTPGNDKELAAGFLFTEGIICDETSVREITQVRSDENRVLLTLRENVMPVLNKADRNFYSTSSCGICGKASIDAITTLSIYQNEPDNISVSSSLLYGFQDLLKEQQPVFQRTGGIHACALFSLKAELILLREDVGRHNALDKVVGAAFLSGDLPLNKCILLLSGRASFELLQKAAMAGIKIVAAVGAPSNLAIELAKENGITLIGFLRHDRFNIYSGQQRIVA